MRGYKLLCASLGLVFSLVTAACTSGPPTGGLSPGNPTTPLSTAIQSLYTATAAVLQAPLASPSIATPAARPTSTPTPTAIITATPVPPTPTPTEVVILVNADGSGVYETLEQAVQEAPAGAAIQLSEGSFKIAQGLVIEKPLTIRGAGMDKTTIMGEAGTVLELRGPGPYTLDGITFRNASNTPEFVLWIEDAEFEVANCRFSGWGMDKESRTGAGVVVAGSA